MDLFENVWRLLGSLSEWSFFAMFGMVLLTDAPRYFLGIQATAAAFILRDHRPYGPLPPLPSVSILLAGHNEEDAIEKCVRSLREQTFNRFEIVCVDDGSSDKTFAIMRRLQSEGLVQSIGRLQLRGGKAAAVNLAARMAHGDIFIVPDCDCSFEPNAIEELLRPLAGNASVAAVSGNILVRNWRRSVTTAIQGIEYLVSISLGKTFAGVLDQVCCVSGAFGAFRRDAWDAVGGMDVGGAEDLDFTIRLRLSGYKVVFAQRSICYTDVPETAFALLRQRSRWERDCYWVRFRKYRRLFNPFEPNFRWREAAHQWDFLLFTGLPTLAFPFYLGWLFATFGTTGFVLLAAIALPLFAMDLACFAAAALITNRPVYWRLLPFLPVYGLFSTYVMKLHRLYAYSTEAIASLSHNDNYVPEKVRAINDWRR
jgi:cellulose synthase/poly-beta-1,6-N-acetylglucosamine synthase-like glycosyltransferase